MEKAGTAAPYTARLHRLNLCGVLLVVLLLGKQLFDMARGYRSGVLNAKVTFRLRKRLFDRLLHLPLSELGAMKSGGIVSRLSADVGSVSGLVETAFVGPYLATGIDPGDLRVTSLQ